MDWSHDPLDRTSACLSEASSQGGVSLVWTPYSDSPEGGSILTTNRLDMVDFGLPAAEREHDLDRMFVELDVFQRVVSEKTVVILGNRGAGKSAILKMLARNARARQAQVIELTPEDYSYEILRNTSVKEVDGA